MPATTAPTSTEAAVSKHSVRVTLGAEVRAALLANHRLVIRVDIVDNGPGVPPQLADSIFFPMVSGRADGSGLGLPIAQSLVQRQGGLIEFTSVPGNTVFTVWLPIRNE